MPTTFANTIDNNEILAKRSQCDYAGADIRTTYATKSEVTAGLSDKQDTISDLSTIRTGAELGLTAVQPGDLATVATTGAYSDLSGTPTIPPALSAGNGIDITNNVVSADLDGTSLTNGANGLSVTLPVPDTTGASQGDVLSVGQSGIEWVAPSSGSSDLFYATYASTTFNEIQNAVNDGKYVILSHQGFLVPLTAIIGTSHFVKAYFQTINNPNNRSSSNSLRLTTYICNYSNQWSSYLTFVPPTASASDAGKVLTVNSSGNAEWATPSGGGSVTDVEVNGTSVVNASGVAEVTVPTGAQLVPAATSSDADKVLTVDSQGTPAWSTPAAGGVTDVEVDGTSVVSGGVASITMPTVDQTYDASSTNAQSGVAVASAIAGVNAVPASTSDDADKVLTVDAQGTPGWAAVSLGDVNNVLQVNALPATTEAHTLYLIPET